MNSPEERPAPGANGNGPEDSEPRPEAITSPADGKNASPGWIALHRSEEALALLESYPNAFLLLTQIALRAKWKDCPITGLRAGEALIGDWKKAGLHSPKSYQVAKQRLEKCGLAAFQGGNKGTRAILIDSRVFSVSKDDRGNQRDDQGGNEGEPKGNPRGTNKKERRKEGYTETSLFPLGDSDPMSIIGKLFHRRTETKWSEKEIRAFRAIPKDAFEHLDLVCRYTEAERAKGNKEGRHRRDVLTFLNNFTGEIDRARLWDENRANSFDQQAAKPMRTIDVGGRKARTSIMDELYPRTNATP